MFFLKKMIKIAYCILFFCLFSIDVFAVESNNDAKYIYYNSIIENNQKTIVENQKQIEKIKQNNNDKIAENNKLINNNETGITSNSNIDNLNFEEHDKIVKEELEKERILDEKQLQQRRDSLLFEHLLIAQYTMFNTSSIDLSAGIQLTYLASILRYTAGFSIFFDYYNLIRNNYLDIHRHKQKQVIGKGYKKMYSLIFAITSLSLQDTINDKNFNLGAGFGIGWQRYKLDGVNNYQAYHNETIDSVVVRVFFDIGYSRLFLRMMVDMLPMPNFKRPTYNPKHSRYSYNNDLIVDFSIGIGMYLF